MGCGFMNSLTFTTQTTLLICNMKKGLLQKKNVRFAVYFIHIFFSTVLMLLNKTRMLSSYNTSKTKISSLSTNNRINYNY